VTPIVSDPVVDEARAIREAYADSLGNDPASIVADLLATSSAPTATRVAAPQAGREVGLVGPPSPARVVHEGSWSVEHDDEHGLDLGPNANGPLSMGTLVVVGQARAGLLRARYLRSCSPRFSLPLPGAGPRFGPPIGPPPRGPSGPG
jgi:hypothetical protein